LRNNQKSFLILRVKYDRNFLSISFVIGETEYNSSEIKRGEEEASSPLVHTKEMWRDEILIIFISSYF